MTDAAQITRISLTDTAKMVRGALKQTFPGVTFRVRSKSYAGGASIGVRWIDGPCQAQVDAVLQRYTGASFDGMTDMQSYHSQVLVGANGPMEVRFGADYVQGQRQYSAEMTERVEAEIARAAGESFDMRARYSLAAMRAADVPDSRRVAGDGPRYSEAFVGECFAMDRHGGEYGSRLVYQYLYDKELPPAPKEAYDAQSV